MKEERGRSVVVGSLSRCIIDVCIDAATVQLKCGSIPHEAALQFLFSTSTPQARTLTNIYGAHQLTMPDSMKAEQDLDILKSTVSTISRLIDQLQRTTHAIESKADEHTSGINVLNLAHDVASLIKAHSTKLSLLIINKPFTPSAITTVLRELISGPLPGLASAIELCNGARYTIAMASELQYRAKRIFSEIQTFVAAIPLNGKILSDDQKNGSGTERGKGSLANTAMVWKACDDVMGLKKIGVAGLLVQKAQEYRDLLKDALEELQEWGEEESDGEDKEAAGSGQGEDDDEELTAQDQVDNIFGSQRHIPMNDTEKIRPRLESTKKRLRLIILLYQAMVKRRFKTLPHIPQPEVLPATKEPLDLDAKVESKMNKLVAPRLDEAMEIMRKIPDTTDNLANAFYELDGKEIDRLMDECFSTGVRAAELLLTNWEGREDEYTNWVRTLSCS